ncbi:hypothetical protein MNBD_GAMMA08-2605 [hydrothermal vent metagenome]|uniref:PhoD-like phosphatase metallophosphatase domain-containing protein n=1 Tax=hydrothermal vent metagenome TaxID=652676 RepID=A0A3B0XHY6_9ZZZZ
MKCVSGYDREGFGAKFSDAAIIGHTTCCESRIWTRVKTEGEFSLVIFETFKKFSPDDIGKKPVDEYLRENNAHIKAQLKHTFKYSTDLTHVFQITGLAPQTTYYYAVIASPETKVSPRWRLGYEKSYSFKTMPEQSDTVSFGVTSCHDPFNKGYIAGGGLWDEFYDVLDEKNADFVLACGDQVYVDTTEDDVWKWLNEHKDCLYKEYADDIDGLKAFCVSIYRRVYRKYWQSPGLQRVFSRFPTYMIWDDHEIMDGWGSYTEKERLALLDYSFDFGEDDLDEDEPEESDKFKRLLITSMFFAARKVYIEYQHSHNPQTDTDPQTNDIQLDYSFEQNNMGFYTLDMRSDHDFEKNPGDARLLGTSQFERFKSWIESDAAKAMDVLFIVASVPVVHWHSTFINSLDKLAAKDDFRDEWDHESNYRERDKLLDLVFNYSASSGKAVVFLSGDVHSSAIFELTRDNAKRARIFQFTSSSITRPPAPWVAELMTLEKGRLGRNDSVEDNEVTRFKKRAFIAQYNFGLIECKKTTDGELSIWGSIYSGGRDTDVHGLSKKRVQFV